MIIDRALVNELHNPSFTIIKLQGDCNNFTQSSSDSTNKPFAGNIDGVKEGLVVVLQPWFVIQPARRVEST